MRLLFVTQTLDKNDAVLGAYHEWVGALARNAESVTVVCLFEGEHDLPANVVVHSLGKEEGERSAIEYAVRFKWLAWKLRHAYDRVFVHMNQEYILIAGPMWKLLGKPIYLWRNHYSGSVLTDLAAVFCTKVFCTSQSSYTAKYKKTVLMPVGVDLARFSPDGPEQREARSILFLARIAPSKRPDLFIDALGILIQKGISFVASVYGSPLPEDERYYASLKQRAEELGLHGRVRFHEAVPNSRTPAIYRAHELFVNCSPSGMFDKTLFEAAACGCLVLASSEDYREAAGDAYAFEPGDAKSLAACIERLLALPPEAHGRAVTELEALARTHSLEELMAALSRELV